MVVAFGFSLSSTVKGIRPVAANTTNTSRHRWASHVCLSDQLQCITSLQFVAQG